MTCGKRIKELRLKRGLTQYELAEAMGVDRTTVAHWESGRHAPRGVLLMELSKKLFTNPEYLMWGELKEKAGGTNRAVKRRKKSGKIKVLPVYGRVPAGEPDHIFEEILGMYPAPPEVDADYWVVVKGNSMVGRNINEGDMVLVKKQDYPDRNGQVVIAVVNGEVTVKEFRRGDKGNAYLKAANSDYEDIDIQLPDDNLRIIGVVKKVLKDV